MQVLVLPRRDLITFVIFAAVVLLMPIWLEPFGAAYPGLLQKFAIFAIFAIGFNILFGLTGYLASDTPPLLAWALYGGVVVQAADHGCPARNRFCDRDLGAVRAGHRLSQPAPFGHLLLDPDARFRADVLQPRLFGAHADHQWRDLAATDAAGSTDHRSRPCAARRGAADREPVRACLHRARGLLLLCGGAARRLLRGAENLRIALRHDAQSDKIQPDAHELHRFQHPALCTHRLRYLRHVRGPCWCVARGDRPPRRC